MSTIVKAAVPTEQFALRETFREVPEAEFDAVRLVTQDSDQVMPLLWASNADPDALTAALESDPSTDGVELVSQLNDESLYRMTWTARARIVTHVLVEERGAIVSARGRDGAWTFRILFPERDSVSATYECCERYDIDIEFERIYQLAEVPHLGQFELTEEQFQTVKMALEEGYYEVPRGTTLEGLSRRLGVSHQALSERLRRGHRTLVENVLRSRLGT